jgi:hypothetical protein
MTNFKLSYPKISKTRSKSHSIAFMSDFCGRLINSGNVAFGKSREGVQGNDNKVETLSREFILNFKTKSDMDIVTIRTK